MHSDEQRIEGYLSNPIWDAIQDDDSPDQSGFDVMPKSYHDDMNFMRIAGSRTEYERLHNEVELVEVYRLYLIEVAARWEYREEEERRREEQRRRQQQYRY